ncbi:MAG: HNH endonuclease [Chloroflexota bacterium]
MDVEGLRMSERSQRAHLSRKDRFEGFKRDKFTCQYCGRSASDVVLEVDHIQPVSKSGDNDLLNLITSCKECNSGKGHRQLSDDSVVQKRKAQLDDLQERREQMEMMLEWQKGLRDLDGLALDKASELWSEPVPGYHLSENGLSDLGKTIRRFGLGETLAAMRASSEHYLEFSGGGPTNESVEKAFDYIARIAAARQRDAGKPYMRELYCIRGIVRNRCAYFDPDQALELLEEALGAGVTDVATC